MSVGNRVPISGKIPNYVLSKVKHGIPKMEQISLMCVIPVGFTVVSQTNLFSEREKKIKKNCPLDQM